MEPSANALTGIHGFRAIDHRLATAGQPTEAQFQTIREAGFKAVINLAVPTSSNALANEGIIVTGLGLSYVHIPVDFNAPESQDFRGFCRAMETLQDRRVFIHCAANMRVSAFVFLYRVLRQGVPLHEAELELHAVWEPDEVWSRFLRNELAA